jgi:hypothetical protein
MRPTAENEHPARTMGVMDEHEYDETPVRPRPMWIRVTAVIGLVALLGLVIAQVL